MNDYKQMNAIAKHYGIAFLGSSYLSNIPLSELALDFESDVPVYNRSVSGLTVDEAFEAFKNNVLELSPSKIFVNIGDEDIKRAGFDEDKFIEKYGWVLYMLHNNCDAKIYIVSVLSSIPAVVSLNKRLKALAKETGCQYVDAALSMSSEKPEIRFFDALRFYMRSYPISFYAAMNTI